MLYLILGKKKCKNCGKLSHKDVLFCWLCGCSFDYRICVVGHKNPPWVQHCLTCGKDRSLMSQPHVSKDLSFVRHPSRRSTFVPGRGRVHHALAVCAVCLGVAILWYIILVMTTGISGEPLSNRWWSEITQAMSLDLQR
jgi:hypothetical protein